MLHLHNSRDESLVYQNRFLLTSLPVLLDTFPVAGSGAALWTCDWSEWHRSTEQRFERERLPGAVESPAEPYDDEIKYFRGEFTLTWTTVNTWDEEQEPTGQATGNSLVDLRQEKIIHLLLVGLGSRKWKAAKNIPSTFLWLAWTILLISRRGEVKWLGTMEMNQNRCSGSSAWRWEMWIRLRGALLLFRLINYLGEMRPYKLLAYGHIIDWKLTPIHPHGRKQYEEKMTIRGVYYDVEWRWIDSFKVTLLMDINMKKKWISLKRELETRWRLLYFTNNLLLFYYELFNSFTHLAIWSMGS